MRRFRRIKLPTAIEKKLRQEQDKANAKAVTGTLDPGAEWERARRNQPLNIAADYLKRMSGPRERCMYCGDSHGTDIEHFWPKTPYPARMFRWTNMLLGCTDCGRIKGDRFPLAARGRLMVKPTVDDPWQFLDFDPATGNLVPRFDPVTNDVTPMGKETVKVLQLDRREALANGYLRSFRRVSNKIREFLPDATSGTAVLVQELKEADDHGILGWCFRGLGGNVRPVSDLRQHHPTVWAECVAAFIYW